MDKKDSAVSVVIIFVMVLAVFAVVISIWALIGIPGQIDEINYHNSFVVENGLADFHSMMFSLFNFDRSARETSGLNAGYLAIGKSGIVNVISSMLIPVGSPSSAAKLKLKQGVGTFTGKKGSIETHTSGSEKTIYLDRLSITFGKDSEIGLEGGGVFRRDGDSAQWVIRPFFDTFYEYDYTMVAPQFSRDSEIEITTNSDVAINTWYTGRTDALFGDEALVYTSSDTWDTLMWYNYFYELESGGSGLVTKLYTYNEEDKLFRVNLKKGIRSPEFGIELASRS